MIKDMKSKGIFIATAFLLAAVGAVVLYKTSPDADWGEVARAKAIELTSPPSDPVEESAPPALAGERNIKALRDKLAGKTREETEELLGKPVWENKTIGGWFYIGDYTNEYNRRCNVIQVSFRMDYDTETEVVRDNGVNGFNYSEEKLKEYK